MFIAMRSIPHLILSNECVAGESKMKRIWKELSVSIGIYLIFLKGLGKFINFFDITLWPLPWSKFEPGTSQI
jgi:hypothetical protein